LKLFIKIFFASVGFLYTSTSFAQYTGDSADGFSNTIGCIQNLNGATGFIPGPIVGSPIFCAFASEAYSITVAGATPTTTYTWAVPAGSTITSGQGTNSVLITFGGVAGNVSVDVMNECSTIIVLLPVTVGGCQFFAGGDNDGFSNVIGCIQNLNGGSGFIPGPIVGSTTFCAFASEAYMITVGGATPTTTYIWSAPVGSTITSGQGTNSVLITFGGVAGNVSVDVANECSTINVFLPVTVGSCQFFAGGDSDGFSNVIGCIQNLNGGSGFIPGPIVGSTTFCAFASEAYSITVGGATPTTTYTWTAPAGSTITSGQGTNSVLITFGGVAGNVSVDVANECSTINVFLPVTVGSCQFFAGGDSDGFSNVIGCIQNLNGGSGFIPGPIVGSTTFCAFASEAYTITVGGATPTTTYTWSAPVGSTITSGQGTNSVLITFGGVAGNVSVDVTNECSTINVLLPVTVGICQFFAGGDNDGFSNVIGCIQNLNGGSGFIPGPIVGSTTFCAFASEAYSITVGGATPTTTYTWTAPAGSTITSGQGTSSVLISFAGTAGTVSVQVTNECSSVNVNLPITLSSCIFYAGGVSDGFAFTIVVNSPLPVQLISFNANVLNEKVQLNWVTASELNNKSFTVERSQNGLDFSPILTLDGAGTTNLKTTYRAEDKNPFPGLSYYRLLQVDFDGTKSYSSVVAVRISENNLGVTAIYPNPVRPDEFLTINYSADADGELNIQCTDLTGRLMLSQTFRIKLGANKIEIRIPVSAAGVYILNLSSNDKNEKVKIVMQ